MAAERERLASSCSETGERLTFTGRAKRSRSVTRRLSRAASSSTIASSVERSSSRNPERRSPATALTITASGFRTSWAIAAASVTGAGPSVFRVTEMENALKSRFTADAIANIKVPAAGLNSDLHGSAEYRAAMVGVMAQRAVAAAAAR